MMNVGVMFGLGRGLNSSQERGEVYTGSGAFIARLYITVALSLSKGVCKGSPFDRFRATVLIDAIFLSQLYNLFRLNHSLRRHRHHRPSR
jgi:hypothetical protein